jgi:hypothetical protein
MKKRRKIKKNYLKIRKTAESLKFMQFSDPHYRDLMMFCHGDPPMNWQAIFACLFVEELRNTHTLYRIKGHYQNSNTTFAP